MAKSSVGRKEIEMKKYHRKPEVKFRKGLNVREMEGEIKKGKLMYKVVQI
jgi:hypothetical protein